MQRPQQKLYRMKNSRDKGLRWGKDQCVLEKGGDQRGQNIVTGGKHGARIALGRPEPGHCQVLWLMVQAMDFILWK